MPVKQSQLEMLFAEQLRQAGEEDFLEQQNTPYINTWSHGRVADFFWPQEGLVVECQGGTWNNGAHVRGKGYENDSYKLNAAALNGYFTLYLTTDMIMRTEEGLKQTLAVLEQLRERTTSRISQDSQHLQA